MKAKLIQFVKNRFSDIILIIAVLLVFFLTGKNNQLDLTPTEDIKSNSNLNTNIKNENNNLNVNNKNPENIDTATSSPTTNQNTQFLPTQIINPNEHRDNNNLKNSLNNIKGRESSTDELINRNEYFNSLSKQLNNLQGQGSSESNSQVNPIPQANPEIIDPDEDEEDEADFADIPIEINENFGTSNQQTPSGIENPYQGITQDIPQVIE